MRRRALSRVGLAEDDLTNAEHIARASDEYWWVDFCLTTLGRLPGEVPDLPLSHVCELRAYGLVKAAYEEELKLEQKHTKGDPFG